MPKNQTFMSPYEARVSRRRFFRSFLAEVSSLVDELRGVSQHRLSDIFSFSDETISKIEPLIVPEYCMFVEDSILKARHVEKETLIELFKIDKQSEFIVARFGGTTSIGDIRRELAEKFRIEEDVAMERIKRVFYKLIQHRICIPANKGKKTKRS